MHAGISRAYPETKPDIHQMKCECERRNAAVPREAQLMGFAMGEFAALVAEGAYQLSERNTMEGSKPWYASHTIWASMVTVVTGLLVTFGMMTNEMAVAVLGELPGYMVGLTTTLSGMWAMWSRYTATKEIE